MTDRPIAKRLIRGVVWLQNRNTYVYDDAQFRFRMHPETLEDLVREFELFFEANLATSFYGIDIVIDESMKPGEIVLRHEVIL